jgi:hypothetical protein
MHTETIADRTKHVTDRQVTVLVQHFDTLYQRACATGGPDEYGRVLGMQRYRAWDMDPVAQHSAGWILGFSYATGVRVADLAVLAAERTCLTPDSAA